LECVSAAGRTLPPLIFNTLRPEYKLDTEEEAMFAQQKSEIGMNGEIYEKWLETYFIKNAPSVRPLLLVFDGLKAHISLKLIERMTSFCTVCHHTPPTFFNLWTYRCSGWKRVASTFTHVSGRPINFYNFARLFKVAWHTSLHPGGFKRSGIYSFARSET